jgi:hypothetical protein
VNESQLATKFMKRLKSALPPKAVIFRHVDQFTRGVPDYSVTLGDKTVWIEFKAEGGKLSPIQERNARLMSNLWIVWLDGYFAEENGFENILSFLTPSPK